MSRGGGNNNFTPRSGYWPAPGHGQPRPHPHHDEWIPMNPVFTHPFLLPANPDNRDARWSSFGGTSHSPLQFIILDNLARDVNLNQRPRRTIHESSQVPPLMASSSSSQEESILTREEQNDVLKKLRREIYNPMPKRIIQRLNLYYRDNAARNNNSSSNYKGKETDQDEDDKRCAVCLEDFEPKEVVMLTPCRHMFHEDCIVPWVKSHGKCPVCRFAICERFKESTLPPPLAASGNNDATISSAANDPFTGALVTFIRAMDEARGRPISPLWF